MNCIKPICMNCVPDHKGHEMKGFEEVLDIIGTEDLGKNLSSLKNQLEELIEQEIPEFGISNSHTKILAVKTTDGVGVNIQLKNEFGEEMGGECVINGGYFRKKNGVWFSNDDVILVTVKYRGRIIGYAEPFTITPFTKVSGCGYNSNGSLIDDISIKTVSELTKIPLVLFNISGMIDPPIICFQTSPKRIMFGKYPWNHSTVIHCIESGFSHILFLDSEGHVMTKGKNLFGQTGPYEAINEPIPIPFFIGDSLHCRQICSGAYHSLFIGSDSVLYGCGHSSVYQLGLCRMTNIEMVKIWENVSRVFSGRGAFATMFESKGNIYCMGLNVMGAIGMGEELIFIKVPTKLKGLPKTGKVRTIKLGFSHSLILMKDGTLFSTGNSLLNGHDKPISRYTHLLDNIKFIDVDRDSSIAINRNGKVYVWGLNNYGQLGTGNTIDITKPTLLPVKEPPDSAKFFWSRLYILSLGV